MQNTENLPIITSMQELESFADSLQKQLKEEEQLNALRIQLDEGLEEALLGVEELESKLPQEQMQSLFTQCKDNAIDAITGHFGLASVVITNQDGGNVNTTHNVREGVYASSKEKKAYEDRGKYERNEYHDGDKNYNNIKTQENEAKAKGNYIDYITGEKIDPDSSTHSDHIVAASTIHNDNARVLAEVDGTSLANAKDNLRLIDPTINILKSNGTPADLLKKYKKKQQELRDLKVKEATYREQGKELGKTDKEKMERLERHVKALSKVDWEKFQQEYDKQQKAIDRKVDKAYYTSFKPYKEAIITGSKDAAKIAVYSAFGIVLRDFVAGVIAELRVTLHEWGNESFSEILHRFKDRIKILWANIKAKWKHIFAGSLESGIQAFFSNFIVFIINTFCLTYKRYVRIIRAGFTSLWSAVKTLANPPADIPKEDVMYEASKIFVTGLITGVTMLGAEALKAWLMAIPGLNVLLGIPIPFTGVDANGNPHETIGDALSLCITAATGAILSTIAIYYMDKFRNQSRIGKLQFQLVAQNNVVLQYKTTQTWFVLHDAYIQTGQITQQATYHLQNCNQEIQESAEKAGQSIATLQDETNKFTLMLENHNQGK